MSKKAKVKDEVLDKTDSLDLSKEQGNNRKMLPNEWATEKKVSSVVVAGAFVGRLSQLVTENEFISKINEFMNRKANGGK